MRSLNTLKQGETATVERVITKGSMRRRFCDIGLIEGTKLECVCVSPQGDPKAYLIRGAVIAIRNKDSDSVIVG